MTIGSNIPASNPLGDGSLGTTNSTAVKVTTGGQKAEVKESEKASGTLGVAQSEKSEVGQTSTIKAADSENKSKPPEDPDAPNIPGPKNFKPKNGASPWFSSTYLSRLSENYTQIAKLGKEMHITEGAMSVLMLLGIAQDAKTNADLIMLKAQKEANMHMAMAISAMVGLAVSVAGAGLSVAGGMKGAGAKMRANKLKAGGDTPDAPTLKTEAKAGSVPVGTNSPARPSKQAPLTKPGESIPDQPIQQQGFRPSRPNKPAPEKPVANPSDSQPVQNQTFSPSRPSKPAPEKPVANSSSKPDNQPAAQAPEKAGKKQPDKAVSERDQIAADKRDAGTMSTIGHTITTSAPILNNIFENLIQMIAKPEIAKTERDLELSRANKELKSKALDSSIQAFNGATEIVDGAVRGMDKLGDVIKANSINSRGG